MYASWLEVWPEVKMIIEAGLDPHVEMSKRASNKGSSDNGVNSTSVVSGLRQEADAEIQRLKARSTSLKANIENYRMLVDRQKLAQSRKGNGETPAAALLAGMEGKPYTVKRIGVVEEVHGEYDIMEVTFYNSGPLGILWEYAQIDEFHNNSVAKTWSSWSGVDVTSSMVTCIRVTHVRQGSLAERCGALKAGMYIMSVGKKIALHANEEAKERVPWDAIESLSSGARPLVIKAVTIRSDMIHRVLTGFLKAQRRAKAKVSRLEDSHPPAQKYPPAHARKKK